MSKETSYTDKATYPNIDNPLHYAEVQFNPELAEAWKDKNVSEYVNTAECMKAWKDYDKNVARNLNWKSA